MLNLISGKQRSGKSYFCVTLIIDYLKTSSRHLYTNLPINPDIIADVAAGGRLRFPALYSSYLSRIHLFVNFSGRSRENFVSFKCKNPDFVKLYHSSYSRDIRSNLLLPMGQGNCFIRQFWRYTKSNSVMFFDEVYEIFGALDQLSGGRDTRRELLSYSKQHGHFKDDLYLITHDPADIDKIIRKSINKEYRVKNSKYQNVLEHRLFKGLRWPVQFFMVSGYEYGSREAQDLFNVFPKKEIFACYNSFSVSDILDKESSNELDISSDTAIDHGSNLRRFFRQAAPVFLLLFVVVIFFVVVLGQGIDYLSSNVSQTDSPGGSSSSGESSSPGGSSSPGVASGSESDQSAANIPVSLLYCGSNKIVFSNGFVLKKGDVLDGKTLETIKKSMLYLRGDDGLYGCRLPDLRAWVEGKKELAIKKIRIHSSKK